MLNTTVAEVETAPLQPSNEEDARAIQRFSLALPARVEVRIDDKVAWHEVTRLEDVSAFGAGFQLKRPVKRGRLLSLSVPMPRQLRCFDFLEPQYRILGLIRRCIPVGDATSSRSYSVGVAFIGKENPAGYPEDPAKLFDLGERREDGLWTVTGADPSPDETDLPLDLRRHTRFAIPESLLLELLDENGDVAASEVTVTENLSKGGAAVFTSFNVEAGSFIRVRSERHNVTIIAVVRGRRTGEDGISRLHLEFIDHLFPLEGIV